ncbi:MAG: AAA family ATPase [Candidatus Gastranaerophilales bacterium]|nr:AAA family ATPase [Candidatus Gastranaerophilales bacterium]
MLQSVPNAIKNAFRGSFIKKVCNYLHDCVREEVKSSTFRNLKADKENKWSFLEGEEKVFSYFDAPLALDGANSQLTELMIQSEMNQKEKYLIYGFLFLVGKNGKTKKNNEFLTPILYAPARLERVGINIQLSILEDTLSLNTGAIAQLIQREDEQEVDAMLGGLLDVVPSLPLKEDELNIFLTTLKSLVPDIQISLNLDVPTTNDDFYNNEMTFEELENGDFDFDSIEAIQTTKKVKVDNLVLERKQAVILTTRPAVTAGVLHELTQIAEKPSGTIRETVLNVINQEFLEATGQTEIKFEEKDLKTFFPITPLSLSDSQEDVIRNIEENDFLAVFGPPGTGKSQTIVNVVAHLIAKGKSVLVASKMDKAVDVVAQRLNELNAPYLALRAGRANYQRQLNMELQELLSNKIELNSDFDDNMIADVDDMKDLLKDIKRLEDSAMSILALEKKYTLIYDEFESAKDSISDLVLIVDKLKYQQLDEAKKIFSTIEDLENKYKKSIFDKIKLFFDYRKIRKLLNLNKVLNEEILKRLPFELNVALEEAKLRQVEDEITSIGNLHQILRRIKTLKSKQKKLAVDILRNKRRTALKNILSDAQKRRRLMIHSKSLVSRKSTLQNRVLDKEDFKPLLSAFPCWCTTTYAISNTLPLKPAMFDVVIIDEASQCDIASCIPVLFRAKKAIIVGDDKQLPHLSFLEKAKEQSFLSQYNIDDRYQLMWRYRDNSMFDLANYYSTTPVLLDEHFRSPAPIIKFSSQEFYGDKIKIMSPDLKSKDIVELRIVKEGKVDHDATKNTPECEEVVKTIQELIIKDRDECLENPEKEPVSIGVISPFRAQVDLIKKAILKVFDNQTISRHKLDVGTAHTFQGDERDIMLLSWTFAPNSHTQSLIFAQKPNLFNVAITRARHKLINFISREINELPEGLLRNYLEYVKQINSQDNKNTFKNEFEKEVFEALKDEFRSFEMMSNIEMGSVFADIVINKTVIEIDGVEDNVKCKYNDMKKQAIMERCGFSVIRITKREWQISQTACIDRIRSAIS